MRNVEFHDSEVYPVTASAGGSNAYCMGGCDIVGYQPGYCICVNKIQAYERDGTLRGLDDCENAIKSRTCPAVPMREKELAAGHALYYVNRKKLQAFNEEVAAEEARLLREMLATSDKGASKHRVNKQATAHLGARSEIPTIPRPSVPKTVVENKRALTETVDTTSYADAINSALKEEPKPAPVVVEKPKPKPEPAQPKQTAPASVPKPQPAKPVEQKGESLLELARRMIAKQQEGKK